MNLSKIEEHKEKVGEISKQVSKAFKENRKLRIYHGFSHTTRELNYKENEIIDVSGLNNILEINTGSKYALVEPNITMGYLASQTMEKGLIPLVVPELPKITIGGAIQGAAGESSSFKYGGVHNTCDEYEVVLGNGEVIKASNTINPELFWGMPCSYGSLGITTLAKIRLAEVKKFIKLTYLYVNSFSELLETIEIQTEKNIDFIDAILFASNKGVVMVGHMVDNPENKARVAHFSSKSDDWFYIHVLNRINKQDFTEDYMPLSDYLFRYNQGAFWTGKLVFDKLKIPFTKFTRSFFYKRLDAESLGKAVHAANNSQSGICQDFCLPNGKLVEFLEFLDKTMRIYPLWLCPLEVSRGKDKFSPTNIPANKVTNVGIYAGFNKGYEDFVKANKGLEAKLIELKGRKVLYAHQYYSPQEFWNIYDFDWYNGLREKYLASNVFPDIYEKTHVNKKYKTRTIKTVLKFLGAPFK